MSFIERPNIPAASASAIVTDNTADGTVMFLEEGVDAVQENIELSGVVAHVYSQFEDAETGRYVDEQRWLQSYRNYRGLYGPNVQFRDDEQSRVFVKITKTKVLAAYSQLIDILFSGNKFPIGVQAKKIPVAIASAVHIDPKAPKEPGATRTVARTDILAKLGPLGKDLERVKDGLQEGPGKTPTSATWEPAKEAATRMEGKISDQLAESEASKHLRSVAFEMPLFGSGVFAGPFAFDKEYPKWNEEGVYEPVMATIPKGDAVSIWDFYPDAYARSMSDATYAIRRHRMSKSDLRRLKRRPYFRHDSIDAAIERGPSYTPKYWETTLNDNRNEEGTQDRYEVLEYWGVIDADMAEDMDTKIPKSMSALDELQVNIWVCNGQILRFVMNPFKPARIPFCVVPYEMNPYSMFGIGVAENMEDMQLLMNGFMRLAVDNAALSSNIILEVDESNLVPGQSLKIRPGLVIRRMTGAPGQALFATKFPNVTQECMMMFDKARQLADEATGIPSYSHGMSGVMGVGRTASGISMLMGAAAGNIKTVVKNIDDYLLAPYGQAMFSFNMQFNFDKDYAQGDLEVVARGTESLMQNEMRSQRLLQFMQLASNQMLAPFVKFSYILRELAKSMDLDAEMILNDEREAMIQAEIMAKYAAMMPQGTQGAPGGGGNPAAVPGTGDPTGNGGGNMGPGNAPAPGTPGFTGNPQAVAPQAQPQPQQVA